ncbi:MAG: deoxyribonuclease IV [Bacillota bacterium]
MRFGAHVSIAGGLDKCALRAVDLGLQTIQIFSRGPRGGKARPIGDTELAGFSNTLSRHDVNPVVIHTPYYVNIASSDDSKREYSVQVLLEDLQRAKTIGAPYVVVHAGRNSDPVRGEALAIDSVDKALSYCPDGVMLLLENTAGQGGELGHSICQLARLRNSDERVGICLDTCHAHAAGYDLSELSGWDRLASEVDAHIGWGVVRILHVNDAASPSGSFLDRHARIGEGSIGLSGFSLAAGCSMVNILPWILETPVDSEEEYVKEIQMLRALSQ